MVSYTPVSSIHLPEAPPASKEATGKGARTVNSLNSLLGDDD
jgi:hypothetical protein